MCSPTKPRNGTVENLCKANSVRGIFKPVWVGRDGGKYGFSLSFGVSFGVSITGEGSTTCIDMREGDRSCGSRGRSLSGIVGEAYRALM